MGSYVYFKNSPPISLLFFRPLLLMLYLKKKPVKKSFIVGSLLFRILPKMRESCALCFKILVDPIPALFTLPN